jgi:EmrB/QacA subfamily drug resistance transporter
MSTSDPSARRVLALTSLGVFIVFLDTTIVNVAFNTISQSFHTGIAVLVWALNAYTLIFAACLIPAGQLTDRYSRRRMFQVGLVGFALASAACGIAPNVGTLVAARIAQAVFGAIIVPSSLAVLLHAFPRQHRAGAISTWGAMAAVATAIGPTAGALLIEYASWRWVFLINVPICLLGALWSARTLPTVRGVAGGGFPDPLGLLLCALAPALLSFGVVYGPRVGWTQPWVAAALVLGVLLLPVLVWRTRRARHPAVDLTLFGIRNFQASNLATLVFSVAFFGFLLSSLLFLQNEWHYSVLRAALAASPSALVTAAVAPPAGRLADRFGYRTIFTIGALCYGAGIGYLALFTGSAPNWLGHWLPALVLNGIGVGLGLSTLNGAVAGALPTERFGVGSAVNNSFRQFGALLGVSLFVATLGDPAPAALLAAYHRSWWLLAAVAAASAVVYAFAHRPHGAPPPLDPVADAVAARS